MSTGRVLWIIWCCGWAGMWLSAALWEWPRQVCGMYQVVDPGCMYTVTTGSAWGSAMLGLLAVAALTCIMLPVGCHSPRLHGGRSTVPGKEEPVNIGRAMRIIWKLHRGNAVVRIWSGLACGCTIAETSLNFSGYGECPVHGRQQVRFTQGKEN